MNDLETLREIFKDVRLHVGIGTVEKLGLATDGSILRALVNLLPENREIVCEVCFADVYDVTFPELGDLMIVVSIDGQPDESFAIKVVNTTEEPIPAFAQLGHKVAYARPGKKAYFGSDTKIGLARPGKEPAAPLVLGDVLIAGLTALANALETCATAVAAATASGEDTINSNPVSVDISAVTAPFGVLATAITSFISVYLSTASTNVASQIAFTERGTG